MRKTPWAPPRSWWGFRDYLERKVSRAWLTSVAWVQSRPWGGAVDLDVVSLR